MKIGIANDHAGTDLKKYLLAYLTSRGYEIVNYGTDGYESYDYPVAGEALANGIVNGECDLGIAICGTGVGISIACNKVNGVRACCCSEKESARLTREHNDANIICFGARIIDEKTATEIVDAFLHTPFSEGERHKRRIAMLRDIELRQGIRRIICE